MTVFKAPHFECISSPPILFTQCLCFTRIRQLTIQEPLATGLYSLIVYYSQGTRFTQAPKIQVYTDTATEIRLTSKIAKCIKRDMMT